MRRMVYSTAATLALLVGIAAGWTWQQWQPVLDVPVAGVEAVE